MLTTLRPTQKTSGRVAPHTMGNPMTTVTKMPRVLCHCTESVLTRTYVVWHKHSKNKLGELGG